MRAEDWKMAIAVRDHWRGKETPDVKLCPLLADLDRMLAFLDEQGIKPGDALWPCPVCRENHRWALLSELVQVALDLRPIESSKILELVDQGLHEVRALYGGKEGYKKYQEEAEKFFARVGSDNNYKL